MHDSSGKFSITPAKVSLQLNLFVLCRLYITCQYLKEELIGEKSHLEFIFHNLGPIWITRMHSNDKVSQKIVISRSIVNSKTKAGRSDLTAV